MENIIKKLDVENAKSEMVDAMMKSRQLCANDWNGKKLEKDKLAR